MPYHLSEDKKTVLDQDGKPVPGGEHEDPKDALAHMQAMNINVDKEGATMSSAPVDAGQPAAAVDSTPPEAVKQNIGASPATMATPALSLPASTVSEPALARTGPPQAEAQPSPPMGKVVQDIPGLSHAVNEATCGRCQFHRDMVAKGSSSSSSSDTSSTSSSSSTTEGLGGSTYCAKYDSIVQCDWTCASWVPQTEHPDAAPIPETQEIDERGSFGLVAKAASSQGFNLFFPITKVDEERREVWGYAILEEPDRSNEILDYASSLPYFLKWSADVAKESRGQSLGNVREMHEAWAAGKLISFQPDDVAKGFFVGAKVVDEAAWTKVAEGVYTGFSVGGQYIKRWPDRSNMRLTRYTADPGEVSLVDRPCVPGAGYQMIKRHDPDLAMTTQLFRAGGQGKDVYVIAKAAGLPQPPGHVESTATKGEAEPLGNVGPLQREGQPFDDRIDTHQRVLVPRTIKVTGITGAQAVQQYGASQDLSGSASKAMGDTPPTGMRSMIKLKGVNLMDQQTSLTTTSPPLQKDTGAVISQARNIMGAVQQQIGRGEVDAALLHQLSALLEVSAEAASDMHTEQTGGHETHPPVSGAGSSHQSTPSGSGSGESMSSSGGSSSEKASSSSTSPSTSGIPSSGDSSSASSATPPPSSSASSDEDSDDEETEGNGSSTYQETHTMTKTASPPQDSPIPAPGQPKTFGGVPPASNIWARTENPDEELIPSMLEALASGSLRKAQALVGFEQPRFDALFTKSLMWWMTQEGITAKNVRKLHTGAPADFDPDYLKKGIVSTDIPGIYLMRLARLMLPVYAGLVRRLPAATPETGADKAQWRAQLGFQNLSFANNLHVAEGGIGDEITESFLTFATPYRDLALNDKVTLKATAASRGYDDPLQVAVIRALTAVLQLQERKVIGDNAAALATPASVAGTPTNSGGALGAGTATTVSVTALSYTGWLGGVKGGALAAGSGETDSAISASIVTSGGASVIAATWPAVPGAAAYNVYVSSPTGTAIRWVATVTSTAYTITAYPGSGNAPPAGNTTLQATGYEGLLSWAELSTIYSNVIPNKVTPRDLAGAALTTNGSGITEFDSILADQWTKWQISPTLILTSANGVSSYTSKIMTLNMPQYRVDVTDKQGQLVGGSFVTYYVNKFAPWADGSLRTIELMAHPYMPDGTFLFLCESIPYPMSRESRGFARDTLIPYTYFPLAQTLINYPFAVTLSEAIECFHPSVQTALTSVKVV